MLQGPILGPLRFLIHINDLLNSLISNFKLFADNASTFSILKDINVSIEEINKDNIRMGTSMENDVQH